MAEQDTATRFAEARGVAREALKSRFWDSLKPAVIVFFTSIAGVIGVVVGLKQAEMLDASLGWAMIKVSWIAGPAVLLALEYRRLYERAEALKTLFGAQAEYEDRIREITEQRDRYQAEHIQLQHTASALQATLLMTVTRPTAGDEKGVS